MLAQALLMAGNQVNVGDTGVRGGAQLGNGGNGEFTLRQWLARALIFNMVAFPMAIIVGGFVGRFPYTREIGVFYGVTVVLPALILFADHLPQILTLAIELVRVWKGQHAERNE